MKTLHRIIKFKRKAWFQSDIDINKAKNGIKKGFWKLMNNAVFGKTMESMRNTEMLNLKQQQKEEIIKYQNQIIILQSFRRKFISNRNEENSNINE